MTAASTLQQAAWLARCLGRGERVPLTPADVERLGKALGVRHLAAGARLFGQGEAVGAIWIVRAGEIELAVRAGARRHVIEILYPGDVTGDVEIVLDRPHAFGARALTDAVVLGLQRSAFDELLATSPRIARRWLSSIAARLAHSQMRILHLLHRPLRDQVVRLLLDEQRDGVVRLPQETIAALLGARRPSVNRVLRELEAEGLVALAYRRIEIRDPRRLERQTR